MKILYNVLLLKVSVADVELGPVRLGRFGRVFGHFNNKEILVNLFFIEYRVDLHPIHP